MRLASIAMYAAPAPVAAANAKLWAFLAEDLSQAGIADVSPRLDMDISYDAAWLDPQLILSQTCGYPYVRKLRGKVRLVATPIYAYPGCDGSRTSSLIVVRKQDPARALADLWGRIAAINEPMSNSGMNLFQATVAPLAVEGRFFGAVVETGGHLRSIAAVADGTADVASIDCVTFGHAARFDPGLLEGVRVLARTQSGPGLPLITRKAASDEEMGAIRKALNWAMAEPSLAGTRDVLCLEGFDVLDDGAYEELVEIARGAERLGYSLVSDGQRGSR